MNTLRPRGLCNLSVSDLALFTHLVISQLFCLFHLVLLIIRMLYGQAPNIQIVAYRGNDIML